MEEDLKIRITNSYFVKEYREFNGSFCIEELEEFVKESVGHNKSLGNDICEGVLLDIIYEFILCREGFGELINPEDKSNLDSHSYNNENIVIENINEILWYFSHYIDTE